MEENRFFRIIWRINSITILIFLLLIIGFVAFNFIKEVFDRKKPPVITNIAVDPQGQEKWTLGRPQEIEGTNFIYIPLVSEKKEISVQQPVLASKAFNSYDHGYFSPSRNLLFINEKTREMKWLFNDNTQMIVQIEMLSILKRYDKDRKIDAIVYQIIRKDTNGDNRLTSDDLIDIAISLPDGSQYKEVLQSVERVLGATSLGDGEILILYQYKGGGYASTFGLQNMSIKDTKEIPKIEKTP